MSNAIIPEGFTRVSSIIYPFMDMDKIDPEILKKATDRGTKVHTICESIMRDFGEFDVDEVTQPYVESFKQWWSLGQDVLSIEKRFFDEDLMVTGQVDIIANVDGKMTIIDLKTSYKPSKAWKIQGSAYAYLARKNGLDIERIQFLHLSKFGKPPRVYEYEIDCNLFFKIFDVWKYFYQKIPRNKK